MGTADNSLSLIKLILNALPRGNRDHKVTVITRKYVNIIRGLLLGISDSDFLNFIINHDFLFKIRKYTVATTNAIKIR